MREIPIGTAYAVWTGINGASVAIIEMVFLGDPISFRRVAFLVLLVTSLIGLKVTASQAYSMKWYSYSYSKQIDRGRVRVPRVLC